MYKVQATITTIFQTGRCVSASESCWRVFEFFLHARHPAVVPLGMHLANGQRFYFTQDNVHNRIQELPQITLTVLAYFTLWWTDAFVKHLLFYRGPKVLYLGQVLQISCKR